MKKSVTKTVFFCQECGHESSKWVGQCPACGSWNSFVEEAVKPKKAYEGTALLKRSKPLTLSEIDMEGDERFTSGIGELDRVLGGGIVKGSLILVGGDPGIGKSTLMLQICRNISCRGLRVLYVSGEESLKQIKMRAVRLGEFSGDLKLLSETGMERICDAISEEKPDMVVVDSIQTMYNESLSAAAGSVSQVRETTGVLLRIAKEQAVSVFIVGHVTKDGSVAGPRVLEHMVDTVLYFEGDTHGNYRVLHAVKNRFGSTDEIGVFEMHSDGLNEVQNPSEYMLSGRSLNSSGSVVACCMEGTRPLLVEIQALICNSNFGIPRRQAAGTDYNRVNLLMAVLEKRLGLHLSNSDAYVNVAGGIRIKEPALDLGIVMAIISSYRNKVIASDVVAFGEVGLSGEVRAVSSVSNRVSEAARLGFKTCLLPVGSLRTVREKHDMELIGLRSIADAMNYI